VDLFLQVRGILNKLTPEKFQKLSDDLLQTELNSGVILKGVILLVSGDTCGHLLEILLKCGKVQVHGNCCNKYVLIVLP
jgi:hypothetical protein